MHRSEDRRGLTLAGAGVEVRTDEHGAQRFHGHAAVFDQRAAIGDPFTWGFFEEVAPGAFARALRDSDLCKLVDHNPYYVVSRESASTLNVREDSRGLGVDSALDTRLSYVNDLIFNIDNRNITGMSFGFYVRSDEWSRVDAQDSTGRTRTVDLRRMLDLEPVEVSSVTFPAYQGTDVGMRAEDNVRAVGLALRERPDAGALFEARSRHCPELGRYFDREVISVHRRSRPQLADGAPTRTPTPGLPPGQDARRQLFGAGQEQRGWYRIDNRESGPAEVLLYDVIGGWFGVEAQDFVRELAEIDADEIVLRINSPGGDVYDGIAIMNALRGHQATVTSVVEGLAASAASFIAMAGDEVVMCPNAEMMIHEAWGICIGPAADMRDLADRLDKIGDNIASVYARKAGGDPEEWRAAMHAETWYSAEEAVEAGLADRVRDDTASDGEPGEDGEEMRSSFDLAAFTYPGRRAAPAPTLRRTSAPPPESRTDEPDRRSRRMASLGRRFPRP